jgi:hypothetical protein
MAVHKQSIRDQLAEVDALIEQAERRATALRDQLAHDGADDFDTVSQLSDTLDKMLQLKLSRDMLGQFVGFQGELPRRSSSRSKAANSCVPRRRQMH